MFNFTAWPEMLAWPYLMLQGWLPYRDIAIAHNPLLLLDLVIFFKLFGVGIIQLKIYTWILIAINVFLTFFVVKSFWSKKISIAASLLYLLLCIVYQGNGLWFDLALTPFALLLFYALKTKNYLWSGIFFALGFLTKQTFVYFAIPIVIATAQSTKHLAQRSKQLIFGAGIIFLIFAIILYALGILDDYYHWAINFGIFYLPNAEGQISLPNLKQFVYALLPFVLSLLSAEYFLMIFAMVGLLGVYPRWELFHFQPALPFIAAALSIFIFSKKHLLLKFAVGILISLFLFIGIARSLGNTTRFFESDVNKTVSVINSLKDKPQSLYVINYWDNIYALTDTKPPKPLIPYIPWYLSYNNNIDLMVNNLKTEVVEIIVIGERQNNYTKLYDFVDKFYSCNILDKKVELCQKN
ncbi:MAG: glycosyltransferase family 39 protein [Microgenomates group bacterium]